MLAILILQKRTCSPIENKPVRQTRHASDAIPWAQVELGHGRKVTEQIRFVQRIRYCLGNVGQTFQAEDRGPRVHVALARRHGEVCFKRIDAGCAGGEWDRNCDGGAAARRSFRQARSVREYSGFYRSETLSAFAKHE